MKVTFSDRYGEKILFETKDTKKMAEYLFDSGYYLEQSVVGSYVDLYLEGNKKSSNKEMQQLIEKELPEKTNSFKEKIELDKKFFRSNLIKMGLVKSQRTKYLTESVERKKNKI